jgi:hypothetical protein
MKCSKAKEHYFSNRDGLLNESERMELQIHMQECSNCAGFCEEMDESLSLLKNLPGGEVSENFVWNVKRKIARQKVELMRGEHHFRQRQRWMSKFVAAAAAVLIIFAAAAWLYTGTTGDGTELEVAESGSTSGQNLARARTDYREMELTSTGYPAGFRMVNDDMQGPGGGYSYSDRDLARVNYLVRENQMLKRQLIEYRNENLKLRKLLYRYADERRNRE